MFCVLEVPPSLLVTLIVTVSPAETALSNALGVVTVAAVSLDGVTVTVLSVEL